MELPQEFAFPASYESCPALAVQLRTGDFICLSTDETDRTTLVRRVIRTAQAVRRPCLSTADHQLKQRHTRVVHIGVISECDAETGYIRITEAVSSGARNINLLSGDTRLQADGGVFYQVYRALPLSDSEADEARVERIRLLTARHMQEVTCTEHHPNDEGFPLLHPPLFKLSYSKLKAFRAILLRAWGWRASPKRVITPLLRDYSRFVPRKELPWNKGKVRSQMCSSLAGVRAQLAEFDQVVIDLEGDPTAFDTEGERQRFSEAVNRLRSPDFPTKVHFLNYLSHFARDWGDLIHARLRYMPLNATYASPMELAEHFESSPHYRQVLTITADRP